MGAEGSLSVKLTVANRHVADVCIASSRPALVAAALAGRPPEDVARLVPLLFPVCGTAHGVAYARALEAALGSCVDARLEQARDAACLGEAAVSHVWQLALAWRDGASVARDTAVVRAARQAVADMCDSLFGHEHLVSALRAGPRLDEAALAADTLAVLLTELIAASSDLPRSVLGANRASFGTAATPRMAALDAGAAGARLGADATFAARPDVAGSPVDASAYARHETSGEVRAVERTYGRGLLARLVARRADAEADAKRLRGCLATPPSRVTKCSAGGGTGTGVADTARGPLLYWVRATHERVDDVRVVAPTDWTFHPAGVLRSALLGSADTPTLTRDTGWLVLALDPCVPCTVEVSHA